MMKKLRETLTGIQDGALEDKHGWVCDECGFASDSTDCKMKGLMVNAIRPF